MFKLVSDYKPTGDQPKAIEYLSNGIKEGKKFQTLLGVTGSGKTFTMANIIQQVQKPTLVLAHNKTLAGQLYSELKEFFPENRVEYFISNFDFYQPEAYIPGRDLYIDKNANELRGLTISQYSVNTYDDYTEYVCMDKYENYYIFKVTDFTEYTVTLDTYTIISNTFKNTYDGADDQGKTMLNCDKWIQMLNNRDYTSAYNVLDETFRNNNFGSVDNFENYMRQNYGEHYDVEFGDFSNEGNTYIQPLTLTPISGSEEIKEITIIMRLSDNYGFTMSFVI